MKCGRMVGGEGWKERVYNSEEWKKLLRTARNHHILHMPMEYYFGKSNNWKQHFQPEMKKIRQQDFTYHEIYHFIVPNGQHNYLFIYLFIN